MDCSSGGGTGNRHSANPFAGFLLAQYRIFVGIDKDAQFSNIHDRTVHRMLLTLVTTPEPCKPCGALAFVP